MLPLVLTWLSLPEASSRLPGDHLRPQTSERWPCRRSEKSSSARMSAQQDGVVRGCPRPGTPRSRTAPPRACGGPPCCAACGTAQRPRSARKCKVQESQICQLYKVQTSQIHKTCKVQTCNPLCNPHIEHATHSQPPIYSSHSQSLFWSPPCMPIPGKVWRYRCAPPHLYIPVGGAHAEEGPAVRPAYPAHRVRPPPRHRAWSPAGTGDTQAQQAQGKSRVRRHRGHQGPSRHRGPLKPKRHRAHPKLSRQRWWWTVSGNATDRTSKVYKAYLASDRTPEVAAGAEPHRQHVLRGPVHEVEVEVVLQSRGVQDLPRAHTCGACTDTSHTCTWGTSQSTLLACQKLVFRIQSCQASRIQLWMPGNSC